MPSSPEASPPAPHVLLLIANDVTADTRVLKYAASLAGFGLRVTVLGIAGDGEGSETRVGGASVVRVAVPTRIKDYRQRRGLRGALRRLRPGYATREDAVATKLIQSFLEREFRSERGRAALRDERAGRAPTGVPYAWRRLHLAVRLRYLRARRFAIYVREGLLNRRDRRRSKASPAMQQRSARFFLALPFLAPWRRVVPEIVDYDAVLGPHVDVLAPDLVHPHDVYLIGVAEGAVARAALEGRTMRMVYDAREYVPGLAIPPGRVVAAYRNLEREYIGAADRVITVSEPIARELQRANRLPRTPDLVLNAPIAAPEAAQAGPSVREVAGVADGVPLLVYSGGLAAPRGVHTVVEALPELPDVHLAVVSRAASGYTLQLEQTATRLGVADRFHLVPFVEPDQVPAYLSGATVGVIPLLHAANHDWALTNKFFEYMHAGLPIISSDVEVQQQLLAQLRVGEVFVAGDPHDLARAVRRVLDDLDGYRARLTDPEMLHRFSWEAQAEVLHGIYRDLLGPLPDEDGRFERVAVTSLREQGGEQDSAVATGRTVLGIGPTNSAGQAYAWAKALERHYPPVETEVYTLERISAFVFPSDLRIPPETWRDADWQLRQERYVRHRYSHVVMESGRGVLGTLNGGDFRSDVPALRRAGIRYAVAFHGSEVRSPRIHRELEPTSPFHDRDWDLGRRLQDVVDGNLARLSDFDGPVYVSTLDLLDYVPGATWLPVVVDTDQWRPGPPVLERAKPVLLHVPSNPLLKGTATIDEIAGRLADRGLVEYRRLEGVAVEDMPDLLRDADILFDQLTLGLYGVQATEAMAAERLVLGYVGDRIRGRLPEPLPVVEVTEKTAEEAVERLLDDRAAARELAGRGRPFVERFHDGRMSAQVLAGFVGADETPVDQMQGATS